MPGLVPGIHRSTDAGTSGGMDPGDGLSAGARHPGTAARRVRDRHHGLLHREHGRRRGVGKAAAVDRHILLDTFRPMPYAEIATVANDPQDAPPLFTFTNGGGLRDMSSDVIDALLRIAGDRAAGIFVVEARHAGGALARQPEGAMPFGFRSPWFISALAAAPTPHMLEGGKRSVAALLEALKPALTGEVLINSLDASNTGPRLVRAGYSDENYRKLVALKDKYDPANVVRFNHNIAPSRGAAKT